MVITETHIIWLIQFSSVYSLCYIIYSYVKMCRLESRLNDSERALDKMAIEKFRLELELKNVRKAAQLAVQTSQDSVGGDEIRVVPFINTGSNI